MWGLMLSTRVWVQLRGARDGANFPPHELKVVENHLRSACTMLHEVE